MPVPEFIPFGGNTVQRSSVDNASVVILPLCYENAPSYGTGSRDGPLHLLKASEQLEQLDEETFSNWTQPGLYTLPPLYPVNNPSEAVQQMEAAAADILRKKKFLLALGGDHAVSLGPIQAASKIYPNMAVLQIDAHLDLRNQWNGSRFNHACVMRRVADDMQMPLVQVGVRSFSQEEADYLAQNNLQPFYAHQIDPFDFAWIQSVANALPEYVYLTIDLDGLDPSVIPGTGTPEPGGLTYHQLIALIKFVGQNKNIIAADIVELVKVPGSHVSEFTAAKIATKIIIFGLKAAFSAQVNETRV